MTSELHNHAANILDDLMSFARLVLEYEFDFPGWPTDVLEGLLQDAAKVVEELRDE